ncbi:MAG TPA: UbiA-like polyprenyltransferase [Dongiaceae bacterium]|nr:UbiA-like polyprenyltransferase [Dongiaceae bacterium]
MSPAPAMTAPPDVRRPFGALGATLSMIKFQHTVFALPFALAGAVLAAGGAPPRATLGWILGAMVGARSAAMVFNRIADLEIDRRNPRTASRPLVTGELGLTFAWAFLAASLALFYLSAAMLNRLALLLATPTLLVLLSYSYAKRFTWLTHLHLGASLGIAPIGAWIAVTGRLEGAPVLLGAGVACWVGGFDILYACQDAEFDRGAGLHAVPARFGVGRALQIARALHLLAIALWLLLGTLLPLGGFWYGGVLAAAALLAWEHRLVRADDLSRIDQAFFTINGLIAFLILAATVADVATR